MDFFEMEEVRRQIQEELRERHHREDQFIFRLGFITGAFTAIVLTVFVHWLVARSW